MFTQHASATVLTSVRLGDRHYDITPLAPYDFGYAVVEIDPAFAAKLVTDFNPDNRKLSDATVKRYLQDMQGGKFPMDTGQPFIIAAPNGDILDGQHRLYAQIKSEQTVFAVCALNVAEEHKSVIDGGKARSAGDILAINKEIPQSWATVAANALKMYCAYSEEGRISTSCRLGNATIVDYRHEHGALLDDALKWVADNITRTDKSRVIKNKGQLVFVAMTLFAIDPGLAKGFLEGAIEGVGLVKGSPAHRLHERLNAEHAGLTTMTSKVRMSTIFKAWNSMMDGKTSLTTKALDYDEEEGLVIAKGAPGTDVIILGGQPA